MKEEQTKGQLCGKENTISISEQIQEAPTEVVSSNFQERTIAIKYFKILLITLAIVIFVIFMLVLLWYFFLYRNTYNFCQQRPNECEEANQEIQKFISTRAHNQNQGRSLVQMHSAHKKLISETNDTQNLAHTTREVLKSTLCMHYLMGGNASETYDQMIELMYPDEESLQKYLEASLLGSGFVQTMSPTLQLSSSCQFQLNQNADGQKVKKKKEEKSQNSKNRVLVEEGCQQKRRVLHFVNGVGYTVEGGIKNVNKLLQVIKQNQETHFDQITFAGPWRKQSGMVNDLLMAYIQKREEAGKSSVSRLKLLIYLKTIINLAGSEDEDEDYDHFKQFVNEYTYIQMLKDDIESNVNFHTKVIQAHVRAGKQVVIVGHSQGSLYSNKIYEGLGQSEKQRVGLLYVGAAASEMADSSQNYMTNPKDRIINGALKYSAFLLGIKKPLPANLSPLSYSVTNHQFIEYLDNYPSTFLYLLIQALHSIKSTANPVQSDQPQSNSVIQIILMLSNNGNYSLQISQNSAIGTYEHSNKRPNGTDQFNIECGQEEAGVYDIKVVRDEADVENDEGMVLCVYAGDVIEIVEVSEDKIGSSICQLMIEESEGSFQYTVHENN